MESLRGSPSRHTRRFCNLRKLSKTCHGREGCRGNKALQQEIGSYLTSYSVKVVVLNDFRFHYEHPGVQVLTTWAYPPDDNSDLLLAMERARPKATNPPN